VILGETGHRIDSFERHEIGLPGALEQAAGEPVGMVVVPLPRAARHLEILGDSLVEPQRHTGDHRMQIAVGRLVAEVLRDPVLPVGVDCQLGVGLHEERPAGGKSREAGCREGGVAILAVEEIEVHQFIGDRQSQSAADVDPQLLELTQQPVAARERKIGVDHQLPGHDFRAVREAGGRIGSSPHPREVGIDAKRQRHAAAAGNGRGGRHRHHQTLMNTHAGAHGKLAARL